MKLTKEQKSAIKNSIEKFTKSTNITLKPNDIIKEIESNKEIEAKDFAKLYKGVFENVHKQTIDKVNDGKITTEKQMLNVATGLETMMEQIFDNSPFKDVSENKDFGGMDKDEYYDFVLGCFANHDVDSFREEANDVKNILSLKGSLKHNFLQKENIIELILAPAKNLTYQIKNNFDPSDQRKIMWAKESKDTILDATKQISNIYMGIRDNYNKLNWFKKWFTSEGHFLRGEMNNIKDTLREANDSLGQWKIDEPNWPSHTLHEISKEEDNELGKQAFEAFQGRSNIKFKIEIEEANFDDVQNSNDVNQFAPDELEDSLEIEELEY